MFDGASAVPIVVVVNVAINSIVSDRVNVVSCLVLSENDDKTTKSMPTYSCVCIN